MGSPEDPFADAGSPPGAPRGAGLRWTARILLASWIGSLGILSQLTSSWARIHQPLDKFLHAGAFAILGFLLALANRVRWRRHNLWMVPLSGFLLGGLAELLQGFAPGRESSLADALADLLGSGLAAIAWWAAHRQGGEKPHPEPPGIRPPWR